MGSPGLAFVLFSPDATVTRLYLRALEELAGKGFRPIACRWVKVSKALVEALYRDNRRAREYSLKDRLVEDLFELDYSLACALRYTGNSKRPVEEVLRTLKGPSDPRLCRKAHLRSILGSPNYIMNRLHTSDDNVATLREARLFFKASALTKKHLLAKLPLPPRGLPFRPSDSIYYITWHMRSDLYGQYGAHVMSMDQLLDHECRLVLQTVNSAAKSRALTAIYRQQSELVARAFGVDEHRQLYRALLPKNTVSIDLEMLSDRLALCGLSFDRLEKVSITCQKLYGALP